MRLEAVPGAPPLHGRNGPQVAEERAEIIIPHLYLGFAVPAKLYHGNEAYPAILDDHPVPTAFTTRLHGRPGKDIFARRGCVAPSPASRDREGEVPPALVTILDIHQIFAGTNLVGEKFFLHVSP